MNDRIEIIAGRIASDSNDKSREERNALLKNYSETYGVEFTLFANTGEQLGGNEIQLPSEVKEALEKPFQPPTGMPPNINVPPPPRRVRVLRTSASPKYWAIARVPITEIGNQKEIKSSVVAFSDSFTGNGLFFNPKPWILIVLIIFGLSFLIWFPFVRGLNKSVSKLSAATEQIAEENFNVRIEDNRTDEIGRLGRSVNHLAERLGGFVHGQKRFLGDISHELNSPLARMNWALALLENKTETKNRKYIENVREEVEVMAKLVDELLEYSKAGMKEKEIEIESINLRELTETVIEREKFTFAALRLEIDADLTVRANRKFLARAMSNILQNAVQYAGSKGDILIKAGKEKSNVKLRIVDSGDGVPENEIHRIFDPLYRVEKDRARKSGGSGLGLAIVKTCVEACNGKVNAKNLEPNGFEITIVLEKGCEKGREI